MKRYTFSNHYCLILTLDGKWELCNPAEEEVNSWDVGGLIFYTQNIWFDAHNSQERYEAIIQMAIDSDADFVCFQEVIGPFFQAITLNKKIQETYYISGNPIQGYGVLILSKLPAYFYEYQYTTSMMGRSLLVAEVCINPKQGKTGTYYVATSHLESCKLA
jgi:endonuclease/exonuclease/phosphatase family metal-dependent hydrolase